MPRVEDGGMYCSFFGKRSKLKYIKYVQTVFLDK